ncbi:hypothetical protein SRRS_29360 [Sporomusa rhizae]|uniref:small, acid-soluble spore protein, alpha/beta type n=1 Tax=Sporomusa rhizae TaxID=357999 RepID=UPI003529FDA5
MSRTNKPVNPAAQNGLDRLKEETAAELGLKDYKNTYKGALTSADNGRVGGNMVRKMIESQENQFGGQGGNQGNQANKANKANQQNAGTTLTSQYDINE